MKEIILGTYRGYQLRAVFDRPFGEYTSIAAAKELIGLPEESNEPAFLDQQ